MARLRPRVINRTALFCSLTLIQIAFPDPSVFAQQAPPADEAPAAQVRLAKLSGTDVQSEMKRWATVARLKPEEVQKIEAAWSTVDLNSQSGEELLELTVQSFALADTSTAEFLVQTQSFVQADLPAAEPIHQDPFYLHCMRLYSGRWLAQHRFYDEALEKLNAVEPDGSIDPASVLFYRAVCQKALLDRESALSSLILLLKHVVDVPPRFRTLAEIMQKELSEQSDEGLGEVSRVMSDVQRRLDLGRSGQKVQDQEQQVITLLDKLLEEMEKQSQQSSSDGGGQGGNSQNQSPEQGAEQSTIKGNPADGDADRKEVTENGAWGMLNKQAEAQARELIRQQFPSNYLDAISRYTKKIAERK